MRRDFTGVSNQNKPGALHKDQEKGFLQILSQSFRSLNHVPDLKNKRETMELHFWLIGWLSVNKRIWSRYLHLLSLPLQMMILLSSLHLWVWNEVSQFHEQEHYYFFPWLYCARDYCDGSSSRVQWPFCPHPISNQNTWCHIIKGKHLSSRGFFVKH